MSHLSIKNNKFKTFWMHTNVHKVMISFDKYDDKSCLGAELIEVCWKREILLRAEAPSVISPLFTTNCDHYSTETATDSIIAVETSPFPSLSPESPRGCQIQAVPSDPLRSINILSSSVKGAGDQRLEKRTAPGDFFSRGGGTEWDCRSEMAKTHVP